MPPFLWHQNSNCFGRVHQNWTNRLLMTRRAVSRLGASACSCTSRPAACVAQTTDRGQHRGAASLWISTQVPVSSSERSEPHVSLVNTRNLSWKAGKIDTILLISSRDGVVTLKDFCPRQLPYQLTTSPIPGAWEQGSAEKHRGKATSRSLRQYPLCIRNYKMEKKLSQVIN